MSDATGHVRGYLMHETPLWNHGTMEDVHRIADYLFAYIQCAALLEAAEAAEERVPQEMTMNAHAWRVFANWLRARANAIWSDRAEGEG